MFVILTLLFTTVLAQSHEKYIDLLPEEEKQQFLDKVARRIMDTVETVEEGDGNKFSRELTDEQLKEHTKFVQEILRQESATLRKRRAGSSKDNVEENIEVNALKTDKNDDNLKHDTSSDRNNVLSVKKVKRRSTEEELFENSTEFIKVHIVTEKSLPMQKRSESSDGESNKKEVPNKISKEEELTTDKPKVSKVSTMDFNVQTKEPKDNESTTDSQGLVIETENMNYTSTTDAPETNYKVLRATGSSREHLDSKEVNVNSEMNENKNQARVNDTVNERKSVKTNKKSENNSKRSSKVEKSNIDNKVSQDFNDKTTPQSIFIDINEYSTPPTRATELNVATTVDYNQSETEKSLSKVKLRAITPTTALPALTPIPQQKSINKKTKMTRVIKKTENALKTVKAKYNLKKQSKSSKKHDNLIDTKSDDTKLRSYRIHEVPLPKFGHPPISGSPEPVADSPLFVPVYRFSPNNAFYNPTNRLGPNAVEENSIELDTRLRGGGNISEKRPAAQEFILQLNNEKPLNSLRITRYHKSVEDFGEDIPAVTAKIVEEHIENDDDTLNDRFPDSHEKSHPMNSMKNGIKTHIQAVRKVLFKNNIYGERGPEKKSELIRHLYGNTDILHKYDPDYKTDDESIALSGSQENLEEVTEVTVEPFKRTKKTKLRNAGDDDIDTDFYLGSMENANDRVNGHAKGVYTFHINNNDNKQKNGDLLILKYGKDKNRSDKKEKYALKSHARTKELSKATNKVSTNNLHKTLRSHQKNNKAKVSIYMKAMKNLIEQDSESLKQYDWLATTVQIQSALAKLFQLIQAIRESKPIHPADVQLFKYTAFLHNFSLELRGVGNFKTQMRKLVNLLPSSKKKIGVQLLKERDLLNRVWLRLRTLLPNLTSESVLNDMNEFLLDVEKSLRDLHEAIKNISQVTVFKHQNWFENIKQLYLTTNEKHLRELLLHISFIRLLELIEQGAENGMEKNFVKYMKSHRNESKKALEEMMFVTKILVEIKNSLKY